MFVLGGISCQKAFLQLLSSPNSLLALPSFDVSSATIWLCCAMSPPSHWGSHPDLWKSIPWQLPLLCSPWNAQSLCLTAEHPWRYAVRIWQNWPADRLPGKPARHFARSHPSWKITQSEGPASMHFRKARLQEAVSPQERPVRCYHSFGNNGAIFPGSTVIDLNVALLSSQTSQSTTTL